MPSVLRIEYDPHSQYCTLFHSYNKRFVSFINGGIKPSSYRRYDPGTKRWMVHASRLPLVVSFGRRYFDHVDYRSLPEDLQIKVVKVMESAYNMGSFAAVAPTPTSTGPHAVLFVLETAPWEVVKAAYRALALKAHPDQGGTVEDFRKIQGAYNELKVKYGT